MPSEGRYLEQRPLQAREVVFEVEIFDFDLLCVHNAGLGIIFAPQICIHLPLLPFLKRLALNARLVS